MNPVLGIALKIVSALAFTLMAAAVKLVSFGQEGFPTGQVVFCRSLFALLPVFLWLGYERELSSAWRTQNARGHFRRAVIGSAGMFCGFGALLLLPLPDATAIGYAAPLITVVLAALVLKETVRIYRWTAVLVGFAGVIVMLLPHLSAGTLAQGFGGTAARGVLLGLAGAICAAFAMIEVRKLTSSETTGAIVFYFSLMATVLGFLTFPAGFLVADWAWKMPSLRDFGLLVLMGTLGGIGQITLTQSYRHADASVVAPFDYTSMIWAIVIGWLLFGDLPDRLVLAGSAIVIGSGIFVILRERALGIERKRQMSAGPNRAL